MLLYSWKLNEEFEDEDDDDEDDNDDNKLE